MPQVSSGSVFVCGSTHFLSLSKDLTRASSLPMARMARYVSIISTGGNIIGHDKVTTASGAASFAM